MINNKIFSGDKPSNDLILIVEDSVAISRLFEYYLKIHFKVPVIKAYTGEGGIEMAKRFNPALILMDIHMPGTDGITATEELRAFGYRNPILVISAWAHIYRNQCLQAGVDAVIAKPIEKYSLINEVEKYYPVWA